MMKAHWTLPSVKAAAPLEVSRLRDDTVLRRVEAEPPFSEGPPQRRRCGHLEVSSTMSSEWPRHAFTTKRMIGTFILASSD